MARTFAAWRPFGPFFTSNSTRCPSCRLRKPSDWIAVWWTNTSSPPPSWVMNPKPFASLNHFTIPLAIWTPLLVLRTGPIPVVPVPSPGPGPRKIRRFPKRSRVETGRCHAWGDPRRASVRGAAWPPVRSLRSLPVLNPCAVRTRERHRRKGRRVAGERARPVAPDRELVGPGAAPEAARVAHDPVVVLHPEFPRVRGGDRCGFGRRAPRDVQRVAVVEEAAARAADAVRVLRLAGRTARAAGGAGAAVRAAGLLRAVAAGAGARGAGLADGAGVAAGAAARRVRSEIRAGSGAARRAGRAGVPAVAAVLLVRLKVEAALARAVRERLGRARAASAAAPRLRGLRAGDAAGAAVLRVDREVRAGRLRVADRRVRRVEAAARPAAARLVRERRAGVAARIAVQGIDGEVAAPGPRVARAVGPGRAGVARAAAARPDAAVLPAPAAVRAVRHEVGAGAPAAAPSRPAGDPAPAAVRRIRAPIHALPAALDRGQPALVRLGAAPDGGEGDEQGDEGRGRGLHGAHHRAAPRRPGRGMPPSSPRRPTRR